MLADFLVPFFAMAVAEIGDKTQIAIMLLAARHKHIVQIFFGAMAASVIVDGAAVILGKYIAGLVPHRAVLILSGVLFLAFGAYSFFDKEESGKKSGAMGRRSVFLAAFALFLVSEFGDKSQVAAFLFGANYDMLPAFLGTIAGIAVVLVIMLIAGSFLGRHLSSRLIRLVSSALFVAVGLVTTAQGVFG